MKALNFFIEEHGRRIFIALIIAALITVLYLTFDALNMIFSNIEGLLKNINKY